MRFVMSMLLFIVLISAAGCSEVIFKNHFLKYTEDDGVIQQSDTEYLKNISNDTKGNNIYGPSRPRYNMNVQYYEKKHKISGSMSVEFTNNLNQKLEEVYFNLWPKADEFEGGDIKVSTVKYNGEKIKNEVDRNHLKVTGFSLPKNEDALISLTFSVKVPEQQHRFGWDGTSVSLGNWYPILAVYDKDGWNLYPYFEAGESFYSVTGDYDVKLTTNNKMVVAATGKQTGKIDKKDGTVTHRFRAKNVRDFAIQMDPDYDVATEIVDGIKVHVYYTKEQENGGYKKYLIDGGRQALRAFNQKVGQYAWDELHIVGMHCGFGGMEYPQLVMICANKDDNENDIKSIIAHEIGHQWFYSAIGNNQYKEPWLDEAFASFMEKLAMSDLNFIDDEFKEPRNHYRLSSAVSAFAQNGDDGINAYYDFIYGFGSKTLNDLRIELGDDVFYKAMQQYYDEMKFGIATTSDFIRIFENVSGEDLSIFFENHYIVNNIDFYGL